MCLLRGTDWILIYNSGCFTRSEICVSFQTLQFSPFSIIPPLLQTFQEHFALARRQNGVIWEHPFPPSPKKIFGYWRQLKKKVFSLLWLFKKSNFNACLWIPKQIPLISVHIINRLLFITKTENVCCAVRTDIWIHVNSPLYRLNSLLLDPTLL